MTALFNLFFVINGDVLSLLILKIFLSKKIKNKASAQNELKVPPKKQSIIETEPVKNKAHSLSHNKKKTS